jgi:hypothetical protein
MMSTKACPNCGVSLRLYNVAVPPVRAKDFADYLIQNVIGFVIFGILAFAMSSWGIAGQITAFLIACGVVLAMYWRPMQRQKQENVAAHGRYHCEKCGHHFEGDGLHQLTS